ncbi:LysR family transcriptional regulator [Diaphorobacter ruginosibacter]|uniref:LysR family transcriptional regulator n=1 Tax=Diaphorobacter ruginosibacter TaxID=1715720 RepID=A0A7G9RQ82_9BURK|nr:LysR family transcriptional regulator [Diaphorobacter ruginosibacter]QNN57757.1 LysR family transcriptional regulator [Diaphorobacter ruginosibacter]
MKTHLLRYFVVLAEERHFGRAAQRLCITQPPLSTALKTLEEDLGVVLVERDAKHVMLTPAGDAFLLEARKVLAQMQRAADVVRSVAQGAEGRLDVGITGSMVYRNVPQYCNAFQLRRPQVELCMHEMSTGEQLRALASGDIDVGFLNIGYPPDELELLPLESETLVACLPQSHALAGDADLDLQQLAHEDFVMFARDVSPANYDNVIACMHQAGIHPRTTHAARQWLTVVALVSTGCGVALVPACMERAGINGVRFVPLRGVRMQTPAIMAWRRNDDRALLSALIETVRECLTLTDGPRSGS